MLVSVRQTAFFALLFFAVSPLYAKYKILELEVKPALEYKAHQDFQGIVIGAYPYDNLGKVKQVFDTDKLTRKGFLPVLLIIENNNNFPIRVFEEEIYLIEKSGERQKPIRYIDVLLASYLKKPLSESAGEKQLHLEKVVKKEILLDFEHKSFGEKIIAPYGTDYGIVFYRFPDEGLEGSHLYLPEIFNLTGGEALMFFEFPLK